MLEIQGPSVDYLDKVFRRKNTILLRNKVRIFYVCAELKDPFHIFHICPLLMMHSVPQTHRQWVLKASHLSTTQFKPQSGLLVFFISLTLYLIYSKTCFPKILNLQMKKTPPPAGFRSRTVFASTDATHRCATPTVTLQTNRMTDPCASVIDQWVKHLQTAW